MLCPVKVNSITIELTVHTSCYCLDLLCVKMLVDYFTENYSCILEYQY